MRKFYFTTIISNKFKQHTLELEVLSWNTKDAYSALHEYIEKNYDEYNIVSNYLHKGP